MLPACPSCSVWRHGLWIACRPSLHFGQRSRRHTLNACTTGCPVFGAGPGWVDEYEGLVPLSGAEELMPERMRTREQCEAELAQWWAEQLSTYDYSHWPADKLEAWRALE